jgi:hypothetical protein
MIDDGSTLPAPICTGTSRVLTLDQLASIPEEEIWSSNQKSAPSGAALQAWRESEGSPIEGPQADPPVSAFSSWATRGRQGVRAYALTKVNSAIANTAAKSR